MHLQYIGLQILEKLVQTRWKSIPESQQQGHSITLYHHGSRAETPAGVRNFIVGVIVKVASDETVLRKERSYVNKLNLALIQVRDYPLFSNKPLHSCIDIEAGMATQLADVHSRACCLVEDQPLLVREQYGYPQIALGGDFRFLLGTNDSIEDTKSEEPNVWRVLGNIRALF